MGGFENVWMILSAQFLRITYSKRFSDRCARLISSLLPRDLVCGGGGGAQLNVKVGVTNFTAESP